MRQQQVAHRIIPPRGTAHRIIRAGDFLTACVLLAITLPVMLIIALAIKCETAGPVFDRQTCIGRHGRRFQMLKFRTAVHDPYQTAPAWTRVSTQVGQHLWRTRIESLPQLVNVLRGDMSLIERDARSPSFLD